MKRSRIVVILELRHEDDVNLPRLRERLITVVKDVAMPLQRGNISVGVSYDGLPEEKF